MLRSFFELGWMAVLILFGLSCLPVLRMLFGLGWLQVLRMLFGLGWLPTLRKLCGLGFVASVNVVRVRLAASFAHCLD